MKNTRPTSANTKKHSQRKHHQEYDQQGNREEHDHNREHSQDNHPKYKQQGYHEEHDHHRDNHQKYNQQ